MSYATIYSYIGTYLAVRKAIVSNEAEIQAAMKYDRPCCQKEWSQKKGLFLLWTLENIDCYNDTTTDKVISVANRWAKNCGNCSVTQAEIDAFLLTAKGIELKAKAVTNGYIVTTAGTWTVYNTGYQII
jgi:hypothetical protein